MLHACGLVVSCSVGCLWVQERIAWLCSWLALNALHKQEVSFSQQLVQIAFIGKSGGGACMRDDMRD
jgi:hypothetical protein